MNLPNAKAPKGQWRDWAKQTRAQLDIAAISQGVIEHLRGMALYQEAQHVLIYLAFGSEINLSELHNDQKIFYTTRTWGRKKGLTIHALSEGLEQHPFGYWQPVPQAIQTAADQIGLALVPGLCFDEEGRRIGYGAAYYDRLLPGLQPEVPRIGIVPEALLVPELPSEAHDIFMTHLVTEKSSRLVKA